MPLVEVTYAAHVSEAQLLRLLDAVPHAVSLAVECPEEPHDGDLKPGDVEVRTRPLGPYDASGLDVVVEVRSKFFESRVRDRQQRCDGLLDRLAEASGLSVGVYLTLPVAAWAQSGVSGR